MYVIGLNVPRSQVWWYTPVIPALVGLRQEESECEAILGYVAKPSLKKSVNRMYHGFCRPLLPAQVGGRKGTSTTTTSFQGLGVRNTGACGYSGADVLG
jgi:hypothetical protein